ncbi:AtpZ/AtpI family protein [Sphingomonas bacterium]|uniref:AtpZ/AtpI family protein n=1 Tax=Sphingomonas bacterium TaxID=1895847 RepID=UPI0015753F07|nr:AtpZ/AtpI family protein [Sphingomonas bacterium]
MADDRQTDLDARLARACAVEDARTGVAPRAPAKGYAQGSRILAELIGAPTGAALIGWLLDRWLGTAPWLMLGLLVLGFVVAFRNVYRISLERPE